MKLWTQVDPYEWATDERGLLRWYNTLGKVWLRGIARILEYSTKLCSDTLNLSRITDQLVIGGAIPVRAYEQLKHMGVTGVIDLRDEARDDEAALNRLGIELLHLPAVDRYAVTQDQLSFGVEWALGHLERGGQVYAHCKHGVGRGPLMGLAILVAQGYETREALRVMRAKRWQVAPNDRQIAALREFAGERVYHFEPRLAVS
jgi:protein tyrosine phosphatase (PTP) superfamily phosphohydrolase (DUF442 family)